MKYHMMRVFPPMMTRNMGTATRSFPVNSQEVENPHTVVLSRASQKLLIESFDGHDDVLDFLVGKFRVAR